MIGLLAVAVVMIGALAYAEMGLALRSRFPAPREVAPDFRTLKANSGKP